MSSRQNRIEKLRKLLGVDNYYMKSHGIELYKENENDDLKYSE